jgi:hypothetical protein
MWSCTDDEDPIIAPEISDISNSYEVVVGDTLFITPKINIFNAETITYSLLQNNNEISNTKDIKITSEAKIENNYIFKVTTEGGTIEKSFSVNFSAETPEISINKSFETTTYKIDSIYKFNAKLTNDINPKFVTYKWILNSTEVSSEAEYSLTLSEKTKQTLILEASSFEKVDRDTITINRFSVDFSGMELENENNFWWGKGGNYYTTYDEKQCYDEKIIDNTIKISNLNFLDMMTIVGFGYSNYTPSTVDESKYPSNQLDIQYAAYPATGIAKYLVMYKAPKAFGPTWNPDSLAMVNPTKITNLKITNNAYAYCSMKYGDPMAKKFEASDWFKVHIKGWDAQGNETGTVEAFLAKDGKIVDTWIDVDLSSLGVVKKITFDMSSSDPTKNKAEGWYNTPKYVCIGGLDYEL